MSAKLSVKLVSLFLVLSVCLLGYVSMSTQATTAPTYDLRIDSIPCLFDANKTMVLDFTSNYRAIIVYPDELQIRSHYLSFYDLNISDGHQDVNVVSGTYCYATIPAVNATLTKIREVNNIALGTSGGSVTVRVLENGPSKIKLRVNSTSNPTLFVNLTGMSASGGSYRVSIDSTDIIDRIYASPTGDLSFNFSGPWSSHILTIWAPLAGLYEMGPLMLYIGVTFGLIAIIVVAILSRVKRG